MSERLIPQTRFVGELALIYINQYLSTSWSADEVISSVARPVPQSCTICFFGEGRFGRAVHPESHLFVLDSAMSKHGPFDKQPTDLIL